MLFVLFQMVNVSLHCNVANSSRNSWFCCGCWFIPVSICTIDHTVSTWPELLYPFSSRSPYALKETAVNYTFWRGHTKGKGYLTWQRNDRRMPHKHKYQITFIDRGMDWNIRQGQMDEREWPQEGTRTSVMETRCCLHPRGLGKLLGVPHLWKAILPMTLGNQRGKHVPQS